MSEDEDLHDDVEGWAAAALISFIKNSEECGVCTDCAALEVAALLHDGLHRTQGKRPGERNYRSPAHITGMIARRSKEIRDGIREALKRRTIH